MSSPIAVLLFLLNFRIFGCKHIQAIGHLAIEPDAYLRSCRLGIETKKRMILLAPTKRWGNYPEFITCNKSLLHYWKKHFIVLESPIAFGYFTKIKCWKKLNYDISHYAMQYSKTSPLYQIYRKDNGGPFLRLEESHQKQGWEFLKSFGMKETDWFVCFHARAHDHTPKEKDLLYAPRNGDINTYFSALKEIEEAGGWCVRMGHPNAPPLDSRFSKLSRTIDYTKSGQTSDVLDIFLAAKCRFFLGGSSGISLLSTIFNIPVLHANLIPFCHPPLKTSDLLLPKLYYKKSLGRLMKFSEITSSPCAQFLYKSDFEREGIELIDNTEEDIRKAVNEMLAKLKGQSICSEVQIKLKQKFRQCFQSTNFCYGFNSEVAVSFLVKHQGLL